MDFVCGGLDQEDWRGCREEELTVGWEGGGKGHRTILFTCRVSLMEMMH